MDRWIIIVLLIGLIYAVYRYQQSLVMLEETPQKEKKSKSKQKAVKFEPISVDSTVSNMDSNPLADIVSFQDSQDSGMSGGYSFMDVESNGSMDSNSMF